MAEENKLGTTYNYTWYFEKRRKRFYKQQKMQAKEFIERLEIAIAVTVRMSMDNSANESIVNWIFGGTTGRDAERSKYCNVCQMPLSTDNEGTITHFKAHRVFRPCEYSNEHGFTIDWTREDENSPEALGPYEWRSGPLLLCHDCWKSMSWYEEETSWRQIQDAIEKRSFKELPPIYNLYASLEKSLRLAEFFELQVTSLMQDPAANAQSLEELKRCVASSCGVINVIGKQINSLVDENGNLPSGREKQLQRNVGQYCSFVASELSCLFAAKHEKMSDENAIPGVTIDKSPDNEASFYASVPIFCSSSISSSLEYLYDLFRL
ncbi:hypothetical protein M3Y97_00292800 [Aphelenchoides bicaudatus]|nr:hypothetical protein M3Y97_00292800 [Aphelenchoides bicaudatus]